MQISIWKENPGLSIQHTREAINTIERSNAGKEREEFADTVTRSFRKMLNNLSSLFPFRFECCENKFQIRNKAFSQVYINDTASGYLQVTTRVFMLANLS